MTPNAKIPYFRPGEVVYSIRAGRVPGSRLKIGYSANFQRRYRELQEETKDFLKILCVMPGDMALERTFHWAFSHWAIGHEWFLAEKPSNQLWLDAFWCQMHMDDEFREAAISAVRGGSTKELKIPREE